MNKIFGLEKYENGNNRERKKSWGNKVIVLFPGDAMSNNLI